MAGVTVRAQVEGRWHEDGLRTTVSSTAQLAKVAVKLLVEDVGTDEARQLIRDELSNYLMDYKGAGVDQRGAKKDV